MVSQDGELLAMVRELLGRMDLFARTQADHGHRLLCMQRQLDVVCQRSGVKPERPNDAVVWAGLDALGIVTNVMVTIHPYRHDGVWVFDDENKLIVREPFVFGMPEMIDRLAADIPGAHDGFILSLSAEPFPGYQARLTQERQSDEKVWYRWPESGLEGWLSALLLQYFEEIPNEIYCLAFPLRTNQRQKEEQPQ